MEVTDVVQQPGTDKHEGKEEDDDDDEGPLSAVQLKYVKFAPTVEVFPIPRRMLNQDRCRFNRRILGLENLLGPFLSKRRNQITFAEHERKIKKTETEGLQSKRCVQGIRQEEESDEDWDGETGASNDEKEEDTEDSDDDTEDTDGDSENDYVQEEVSDEDDVVEWIRD